MYLLITTIIVLQIWFFYITWVKINIFKNVFPDADSFGINKISLLLNDINKYDPKDILLNYNSYLVIKNQIVGKNTEPSTVVEISLIHSSNHLSPTIRKIEESLNTYLIRNRSATPEFNLIKDIVERNCNALEEEINNTISVPLYLGLLGTLVGIIFGLWNISGLSSVTADIAKTTDSLDKAIPMLLGGVKVAMIASAIGLFLTVLNSAIFLRLNRAIHERRKNDFYTFLQIELMPLLNQGINSTLNSLQINLHKFNDNFTTNLQSLTRLMRQNHDALIAQEKVLTSLESIDIAEFAEANIKVLTELQKSTQSFSSFNQYVEHLNKALYSAHTIINKISELIEKTDSLNEMAINVNTSFSENKKLIEFLQSHYSSLDSSKQMLVDSVGGVNKVLKDALGQLESFTKTSINEMQQVIVREIKLMDTEYPEKWKKMDKLDNLVSLNEIKSDLSQIKKSSSGQIESLNTQVKDIRGFLENMNNSLEIMSNKPSLFSRIGSTIKKWYSDIFNKN